MLKKENNTIPKDVRSIHLMGICGTGMAALASMLQQQGFQISGSDINVYPPMSDFLAAKGIHPFSGYQPDNLAHTPDLVIVGNVITRKNAEALELARLGLPYLSFPQALSHFFIGPKRSIVIAGTHGKTTTSSMTASALYHGGYDPSFMIGGIVAEFNSNNRLGEGDFFISEGDEYDTAFFDKASKFLHYRPEIAVITSIEFDHADIFSDIEEIKEAFKQFVALLPPQGLIIAQLDDANVAEVVKHAPCRVAGYGLAEHTWQLKEYSCRNGESSFIASGPQGWQQKLTLPQSGRHNCLNALAVCAVLHHIGVDMDKVPHLLSLFKGVKRRQEVRGEAAGVTVIDDFAHHPTAVRETLSGLKLAYSPRRLVVVFEPRTNSSRRDIFQEHYAKAFDAADLVLIREPLPLLNVAHDRHFNSVQLAEDLLDQNIEAYAYSSTEEILEALNHCLREGDVVAILSNGGFDNIHERLLSALRVR